MALTAGRLSNQEKQPHNRPDAHHYAAERLQVLPHSKGALISYATRVCAAKRIADRSVHLKMVLQYCPYHKEHEPNGHQDDAERNSFRCSRSEERRVGKECRSR